MSTETAIVDEFTKSLSSVSSKFGLTPVVILFKPYSAISNSNNTIEVEANDKALIRDLRNRLEASELAFNDLNIEYVALLSELSKLKEANIPTAPPKLLDVKDNFTEYGIEFIGLDATLVTKLHKQNINTIKELEEALRAGNLKSPKITRDEILSIAFAVLGKAPSHGFTIDTSSSAKDRKWLDRVKSAIKKQKAIELIYVTRQELIINQERLLVEESTPDTQAELAENKRRIAELDADIKVYEAHVKAILWCCGAEVEPNVTPVAADLLKSAGFPDDKIKEIEDCVK